MKNTFAALAILIVSSLPTFSQDVTNAPYFGLKAAANFSTNSFSSPSLADYNTKYKTGFAGGLYYNIPIANRFSIQPEFLYSQMGSKLESTVDAGNNVTMEIDYITMPFLLKFSPIKHLAIFAGPEVMLKADAWFNYASASNVDIKGQLKDVDVAVTLGLEYWVTKNFGIYARYNLGLSNLNENDPGLWLNPQIITSKISNSAIQVGITIGFPESEIITAKAQKKSIPPPPPSPPRPRLIETEMG